MLLDEYLEIFENPKTKITDWKNKTNEKIKGINNMQKNLSEYIKNTEIQIEDELNSSFFKTVFERIENDLNKIQKKVENLLNVEQNKSILNNFKKLKKN